MYTNENEDYLLVLEDRSEVKEKQTPGKLSVISGIDENGNLKTEVHQKTSQTTFLKFNSHDGMLKNFMTNFLKQFNEPSRFGLYKVLANNVEQEINNLRSMLQNKENPEIQQQLKTSQISFDDYLPKQSKNHVINPEKIHWEELENLGLSREKLKKNGELTNLLNGQKLNLS